MKGREAQPEHVTQRRRRRRGLGGVGPLHLLPPPVSGFPVWRAAVRGGWGAHRMRQVWLRTCGDSREAWPEALCVRFSYGFMALILQDRFGIEDAMRYESFKGGETICERRATAPPHGSFIPMTEARKSSGSRLDVAGSTHTKKTI